MTHGILWTSHCPHLTGVAPEALTGLLGITQHVGDRTAAWGLALEPTPSISHVGDPTK